MSLVEAIKRAYVEGRIGLEEFERDLECALRGRPLGAYRSRYSTEEPAGPVHWWEPKYPEAECPFLGGPRESGFTVEGER